MNLDHHYWNKRYLDHQTGWNIGYASTPIVAYINQLEDKNIHILIPGAGNAYEAEFLFKSGFKNIFVLDFVESALLNFKKRVPDFPTKQLICEDFFNYKNSFDLILEQTFFCALLPEKRISYVTQMKRLLNPSGKIAGLLFNKEFEHQGPPFGGNEALYRNLFEPHFRIKTLAPCYNSIEQRQDNELFFIFENSK